METMKSVNDFPDRYVRGPHLRYFLTAVLMGLGLAILLVAGSVILITVFVK